MKIHQLISKLNVMFTNEETEFLRKNESVKIDSLDEHNQWLAQNLVRKGAYKISTDNQTLIKQSYESTN